jgi:hypothetical protein
MVMTFGVAPNTPPEFFSLLFVWNFLLCHAVVAELTVDLPG